MSTYKGKEGSITIGASPGTALGELRSFELTESANLVDVSRMGDDWTRDDSTQKSWSVSFDLWWDPDDAGQALIVAGDRVTLNLFPQGNGAGTDDIILSGLATISEVTQKQSHDNIVELSCSAKGYGALTKGTI